ncbi:TetR/AcrR family transcriptional regulator [Microbacterium gallinarum]|jgi:AcrR family transcriptional regulator|uniref:TetR family transcriptional regulator n=1 Tax=Microbacterium gallinarum TaxID=2762209 RepID=A0ABR8X132_9MICO|nr:TetR/AcrR family transcriptional regulator [Microbacterium gallinarum]MBD8022980.1 TetR family transcriptional regulator [Microbacterium gallinarum]
MTPYVSPLREAQAAQTRARILDAAIRVFGEAGYSGASLGRIANEAGVSLETVKQNGPKAALLLAGFDHAFAGSEGEGPLHTRELGEMAEELDPSELLPFLVEFVASANARVARLWPRLLEAAAGDDDVAQRLRELQANRRSDMLGAVAMFRGRGVCSSARSDGELADALSFVISPESYTQLVAEAGWSEEAYHAWLVRAVERVVLTD